jgi:methionyl-tRNA formyltransferase
MSIRVVFWGSAQSVFSNRHYAVLAKVPCQLVAVIDTPASRGGSTNPLVNGFSNFVDQARAKDIPLLSPNNPNDPDFIEVIRDYSPDVFIAVGYDRILKPTILAVPRLLAANFHASLLPHYRGKHPVFWALRDSKRWAGLTVHIMDPGIDTGDIIYQVKVRTRKADTVSSLYERIMAKSVPLIGRLVDDVEKGTIPRRTQELDEGSYFSSIKDEDYAIDWSWDAEKIRRTIVMTPGKCYSQLAGQRLYFSQAEKVRSPSEGPPGTVLGLGRTRCLVASGDGAVWLGRASIGDGEEQSMASICREHSYGVGDALF